jgi:RimJ/RimL family protein N-acetyltransferase
VVSLAPIPTFETARLLLRPYRLDDFDAYAAMWRDPSVVRYIGGEPFSRDASWTRFLRQIGLWHHLGFGFFAIEDKTTGAFGGECGFHDLKRSIVPPIEGTMEAGWALAEPLRGRGLAEEAMRAALGWAATDGIGDRLTALIHPDNTASQRLAARLGFVEFARSTLGDGLVIMFERQRAEL